MTRAAPVGRMPGSKQYLRVNDKDKRATAAKDELRVKGGVEKVNLPRKVPDLSGVEGREPR